MEYPLLRSVSAPGKVKKLPVSELPQLCAEIRQFLIESVSATGGHLASNLGVVELTVALHYVYDLPETKILFDVGHQCYTHKLLTGRMDGFGKLRQKGGISGFPCPAESEYDAFVAGHGSAALSAAIGVARAKKLKNEPGEVIVIVGDGAFTGGMVYEGMNNIGALDNLTVILNDNEMSISRNVGKMADYLTRLRTDPRYFRAKAATEGVLTRIPLLGRMLVKLLKKGKQALRREIYHSTVFEELGFQYVGPVDGHDTATLVRLFRNLQEQTAPLFIHAVTQKGKGLRQAEENPGEYHAVSAFDPSRVPDPEAAPKESFSTKFGTKLTELAEDTPNLCAITAAMESGTGLQFFRRAYPARFFDVGMAEEHAVTFAAGLASQGMLPVAALYSTFLQRAYDQIIHDVSLSDLDVIFAVDRAGLVPGDGETHQGIYDPAIFSELDIPVFSPSNYAELSYWLGRLVRDFHGPRAIRYARGEESPELAALGCTGEPFDFVRGDSPTDTVLVSYGTETAEILRARDILRGRGIPADCCKLVQICPIPGELVEQLMPYSRIVFAEECVENGGIGQQLCAALHMAGWQGTFRLCAADRRRLPHASVAEMRAELGLDGASIARVSLSFCANV